MKHSLVAVLLLAAVPFAPIAATTVFAQGGPVTDPAKVEGGSFAVDPYHTVVMFGVSHVGFTTYYGRFSDASGTLDFKPKAPDGSDLSVSVPVATVSTPADKLTGELKGPDWLNAAAFPTMTFKSTKIKVTGKDVGQVTGELTLHGVTKPVTLTVTFNGGGINPIDKAYTLGFSARGTIKRSDFGVKTYVPLIGDDVELIISGAFEKRAA